MHWPPTQGGPESGIVPESPCWQWYNVPYNSVWMTIVAWVFYSLCCPTNFVTLCRIGCICQNFCKPLKFANSSWFPQTLMSKELYISTTTFHSAYEFPISILFTYLPNISTSNNTKALAWQFSSLHTFLLLWLKTYVWPSAYQVCFLQSLWCFHKSGIGFPFFWTCHCQNSLTGRFCKSSDKECCHFTPTKLLTLSL